jgi:transmembrane sensor
MSRRKNIVEFPNLKAIEEEAAVWVARVDGRDALPTSEITALKEWITRSPQHKEALERMSLLWGGMDILDELNYLDSNQEDNHSAPLKIQSKWWVFGAIAASLLIAAVSITLTSMDGQNDRQSDHYITAVGQQETVKLADGSQVILNTNSEISVELTDQRRSVNLLKGEAHFDVAPDVDRPFLVYAKGGIVKAVGTAFTVLLREKSIEVTVSEGVVALISRPQSTASQLQSDVAIEDLMPLAALTIGQSAVFAEHVESLTKMSDEALDRKLLWRGGFIAFAGEPLSTVVADVSRYTDIMIEIDDPTLENLPIGGYFKVGQVEDMFHSLEASFGIRVHHITPNKVKLTRAS